MKENTFVMDMMRIGLLLMMIFLILGCDPSKKAAKKTKANETVTCPEVTIVDGDFFQTLSSADYQLTGLKQNGNILNIKIKASESFREATLYWTGAVMKSYPPQASVKLVLEEHQDNIENEDNIGKHELCFDISKFEQFGNRIKVYMMDDEEAIDLEFKAE